MEKGQGKWTDTLKKDNDFVRRGDVKCLLENTVCLHEELPAQIDIIPAADVVARDCYDRLLAENDELRKERPTAHSRFVYDNWDGKWICLNCMHSFSFLTVENAREEWDYCPNCGARMDKDGDEE